MHFNANILKKNLGSFKNLFQNNPFTKKVDSQIQNSIKAHFHEEINESIDLLVKEVKKTGFILLETAFSPEIISQAGCEFENIIQNQNLPYRTDRFNNSICVRVKPTSSLSKGKYPVINAFCNSNCFAKIAKLYFDTGLENLSFNQELFVHESPPDHETLSNKMHWDIQRMLKFWFYVDTVDKESGAMSLIPNSMSASSTKRAELADKNIKLKGGIDNVIDGQRSNEVFCSGKKGSILIFDTECLHSSNPVEKGHCRKIMRAHTYRL